MKKGPGTVTLEDLIYSRLTGWDALTAKLARVDGQPAIYYQVAPGDTADGWGGKPQYPRIDYTVDMQSNPERPRFRSDDGEHLVQRNRRASRKPGARASGSYPRCIPSAGQRPAVQLIVGPL